MIDHVHMTPAVQGSPCICEAGTEIPGSSSFVQFLGLLRVRKKVEKASSWCTKDGEFSCLAENTKQKLPI